LSAAASPRRCLLPGGYRRARPGVAYCRGSAFGGRMAFGGRLEPVAASRFESGGEDGIYRRPADGVAYCRGSAFGGRLEPVAGISI